MSSADHNEIARQVLQYFLNHPHAQDDLPAIAKWWISTTKNKISPFNLRAVLDHLTAEQLLIETNGTDLRRQYRINMNKKIEIQELLKQRHLIRRTIDKPLKKSE